MDALKSCYVPILRDYVLEIIVLFAGARSGVGGLKEVCALAAVTLAWDCLLLCTLFSAILTIMVEVRRIKTLRSTISRTSSMASMRGLATKITAYTPSGSPRTSALKHAVEPNGQSPPTHIYRPLLLKIRCPQLTSGDDTRPSPPRILLRRRRREQP